MEIVSEILNNNLIKQQGLDEKIVKLIEEKHYELQEVLRILHSLEWNDINKEQILQLTHNIELLEFAMQKLWGFPQDKNFHLHWLKNPFCSCPKLDNMDYWGHGQIKSSVCLVHGEIAQPEFWKNLKTSINAQYVRID